MKQHEILSEEQLDEVNMSPSALRSAVKEIHGATAGLEFELIVTADGDDYDPYDDYDPEPDYDWDRTIRAASWDDIESEIKDFFIGDHNSRRDVQNALSDAQTDYEEWAKRYFNDWMTGSDNGEVMTRLQKYIDDTWGADPRYQEELFGDTPIDPAESFRNKYWDGWIEQMEEEKDLAETWLEQNNIEMMSEFGDTYGISWPHWTEPEYGGSGEGPPVGSFSNAVGMNVNVSGSYHGRAKSMSAYTVEPDSSLRASGRKGGEGWEFVSPPLSIEKMVDQIKKVSEWAKEGNAYTNDSTGLHMNISLPGYDLSKLDYVKLALFLGDNYILDKFGRLGNSYARSAFDQIENTVKQKPELADRALKLVRTNLNLEASKLIHRGYTDKFVSINTKDNRVEFRSPGGNWLDMNIDEVINTLLRFVVALDIAMDPSKEVKEYQKKFYKLLSSSDNAADTDTIKYFTQYASGTLPKAALLSFVRNAQRKRDVAKNKDKEGGDNLTQLTGTTPPAEYNPKYSIYLPNTNMTARDIPSNEPVVQYVKAWAEQRDISLDTIRILNNESGMLYNMEGNRDRNLRNVDLSTVRRPTTAQIRYYVRSGTPENYYNATSFVAVGDQAARDHVTRNRPQGQWFLVRDDSNEPILSAGPSSANAAPQSSSASTIPDLTPPETTGGQLYQMLRTRGVDPVIAQGRFNSASEAVQRFGAYADAHNISRSEYHTFRPNPQPAQAASQGNPQFEIISDGNVVHSFDATSQGQAYQYAMRWANERHLAPGRWSWRTVGGVSNGQGANPEGPMYEIIADANVMHEFRAVSPRAAERYAQSWVDEHLGDVGYEVQLAPRNESLSESFIAEIRMNPKSLEAFASSDFAKSMKVGFETEMVVPGLGDDSEPDYENGEEDMDEDISFPSRANYIDRRDRVIRFFTDGEGNNDRSEIRTALDETDEAFMEWVSEEFYNYKDSTEYMNELNDYLRDASVDPEDEDAIEKAKEEFMEQTREEYESEEARWQEFLSEKNIESMHDWMRWVNRNSSVSLYWPYMRYSSSEGEFDADDLSDMFTNDTGYSSKSSSGYHGSRRDETTWIFEPDSSIDADSDEDSGIELVSPPMPLEDALIALERVFKWAKSKGAYTNSSTGFHMGVSIPQQTMDNVDHLKLIMLLGDQYVLERFGRGASRWTKSSLQQVKQQINMRKQETIPELLDQLRGGLNDLARKEINKVLVRPGDRYVSVNIKPNYIEFRSAGGDYFEKYDEIRETMLRYVRVMGAAANPDDAKEEYAKKLYKFIDSSTDKDESTDTIKAFARYASGEINRSDLISILQKVKIGRVVPKTIGEGETQIKVYRRNNQEAIGSDDQITTINATTVNELVKYAREMADKANINYEDIILKPVAKYFIQFRVETGDARENYGMMGLAQNRNYNLGIAANLMNIPEQYAEKVIKFYIEHQYVLSDLVSQLNYIKMPTQEVVDRAISLVKPEEKTDNPYGTGPGQYAFFVGDERVSATASFDSRAEAEQFYAGLTANSRYHNSSVRRVGDLPQQTPQQRQSAQQTRQDLTLVNTIGNPNLRTPNYIFYAVNADNQVVVRIQAATLEDAKNYMRREYGDEHAERVSIIPQAQWHS